MFTYVFVTLSSLRSQFTEKGFKKAENSEQNVMLLLFLFTLDFYSRITFVESPRLKVAKHNRNVLKRHESTSRLFYTKINTITSLDSLFSWGVGEGEGGGGGGEERTKKLPVRERPCVFASFCVVEIMA